MKTETPIFFHWSDTTSSTSICSRSSPAVSTTICNGRGRILAMRAFVTPEATRAVDPDAPRPYAVDFDMTAEMIGVMKERYRVAFGLPGETRGRRRRSCPPA